ncbi:Pentatricopeptide repeat-containing protein, chloroplastic [Symbiodinium microadriaticum]|uniref:Pentatricopeptide repeat-containing protein, chloroplastic n=1 Tax=Symbiodinium microadriaticum TaxID=2951 RepID=A0A1Q9ER32_SYMMI|nr:Pentatricopeptide repeat-containing protein, chloroplastic [Symbiodinium microadriaticum]
MEDGSLVTGKNTGHPTPWCYGCALWTQKGVSGYDAGGSKRFSPRKDTCANVLLWILVFKDVFTKLQALSCTDFDKVLMMDLDMLVRGNLDELFYLRAPAALKRCSGGEQPEHGGDFNAEDLWSKQGDSMCSGINAGVMLLEPDQDVYDRMVKEIQDPSNPEHLGTLGPEQDYLARFYSTFGCGSWTHLHAKFNYQPNLPNDYIGSAHRALDVVEDVVVAHFSGGRVKPWKVPGLRLDASGVRRLVEDDALEEQMGAQGTTANTPYKFNSATTPIIIIIIIIIVLLLRLRLLISVVLIMILLIILLIIITFIIIIIIITITIFIIIIIIIIIIIFIFIIIIIIIIIITIILISIIITITAAITNTISISIVSIEWIVALRQCNADMLEEGIDILFLIEQCESVSATRGLTVPMSGYSTMGDARRLTNYDPCHIKGPCYKGVVWFPGAEFMGPGWYCSNALDVRKDAYFDKCHIVSPCYFGAVWTGKRWECGVEDQRNVTKKYKDLMHILIHGPQRGDKIWAIKELDQELPLMPTSCPHRGWQAPKKCRMIGMDHGRLIMSVPQSTVLFDLLVCEDPEMRGRASKVLYNIVTDDKANLNRIIDKMGGLGVLLSHFDPETNTTSKSRSKALFGLNMLASECKVTSACQKGRRWDTALHLFTELPAASVVADVVSFNTTISAYEKGSLWEAALQVLSSMRSAEALPDVISFCSTVSACEKASEWEAAVHLFSQMSKDMIATDVVAFNATMSACEKASRWQKASHLFAAGPDIRIEPNSISVGALLCALGKAMQWPTALSLLSAVPADQGLSHLICRTATMVACEKGSQWAAALALFAGMPEVRLVCDTVSVNAAISACEAGSQWQSALRLLGDWSSPNVISFSAALSACEKGSEWERALELFTDIRRARLTPTVISFNACISACEKASDWHRALHLVSEMARVEVLADVTTLNSAISTCEKASQWEAALRLFSGMQEPIKPDVVSFNSVISASEKSCRWEAALNFLSEMPSWRISCDVITISAALSACERGSEWERALDLLAGMPKIRVSPNIITYNTAISACETGMLWEAALLFLPHMSSILIAATSVSFGALISACEKGSRWEHALQVFLDMPAASILPGLINFNAALSACEKGAKWQTVVDVLSEMPSAAVRPDVISFNVAVTTCANSTAWQAACLVLASAIAAMVVPNAITLDAATASCHRAGAWHCMPDLLAQSPDMCNFFSQMTQMNSSGLAKLVWHKPEGCGWELQVALQEAWVSSCTTKPGVPSKKDFEACGGAYLKNIHHGNTDQAYATLESLRSLFKQVAWKQQFHAELHGGVKPLLDIKEFRIKGTFHARAAVKGFLPK